MPRVNLWSLDEEGQVYYLSSWDNTWNKLDGGISKVKRFKKVTASQWCIWAIGLDDQVYLFVLKSDATIRISDTIYENERRLKKIYYKTSKHEDPPNFCCVNDLGKLAVTDIRGYQLPSTRWSWEDDWQIRRSYNGSITDEEGWLYSAAFSNLPLSTHTENRLNKSTSATQLSNYRSSPVVYTFTNSNGHVRQRQWKRYRYFSATGRWVIIVGPEEPFIISSIDSKSYTSQISDSSKLNKHNQDLWAVNDLSAGGEMLPHQKDGHVSLWGVDADGQVIYRHNVHRLNPEGEAWCIIKLPHDIKASSISVGSLGHVLVVDQDGSLFFRENISWRNFIGSSWKKIDLPQDIIESTKLHTEYIVKSLLSDYGMWIISNNGKLWSRDNINLHLPDTNKALGNFWTKLSDNVPLTLSSSMSGELWAIADDSETILFKCIKKTSQQKCNQIDFWSEKLSIGLDGYKNSGKFLMKYISASALFLDSNKLPELWKTSSKFSSDIEIETEWYDEIIDNLADRDHEEYKNPDFAELTAAFEQVSWSKSAVCEVFSLQTAISPNEDNSHFTWITGSILLNHKTQGESSESATIHVQSGFIYSQIKNFISFLNNTDIVCASKLKISDSSFSIPFCNALVIIAKPQLNYKKNKILNKYYLPCLYLKFPSETIVEDWLIGINLTSNVNRKKLNAQLSYGPRLWMLNQLHEPFSSYNTDDELPKWYQDGGHFKLIESGNHGRIIWAVGYNGITWVSTRGYGGSYLGSLCTSSSGSNISNSLSMKPNQKKINQDINTIVDFNYIYVTEFEKAKAFNGEYQPYMWINDCQEMITDKDHCLPSQRWSWSSVWLIDRMEECDSEGWQYSASLNSRFENNNRSKKYRRRFWKRQYSVSLTGPWKEMSQESIKIIDISITPKPFNLIPNHRNNQSTTQLFYPFFYSIWAVSEEGNLYRRKGISINSPEGIQWIHVRIVLKLVCVTVTQQNKLCVVCQDGHVWRTKNSIDRDVIRLHQNDFEVLKFTDPSPKFIKCSSGDNQSIWAIDNNYNLWTIQFSDLITNEFTWLHVDEQITHVSVSSFNEVWVLFSNGNVAKRQEISIKKPGGKYWSYKLRGISSYITCRGI